jgi:membrane-bound serine protease (ClpP class)
MTGSQGLIGKEGKSLSDISPEGKVFVHGEIWDAKSKDMIQQGERIEVIGLTGMVMEVKKKT